MTNLEALKLVIELAEQNALSQREVRDAPELYDEMKRQEQAIEVARAFIADMQA